MHPTLPTTAAPPALFDGARMDQPTFHALYLQAPEGFRAELIEGEVCFMSPPSDDHAGGQNVLGTWIGNYETETPHVRARDQLSIVLDLGNEPEPDLALYVVEAAGGATRLADGFVVGAPELVIETSYSSARRDLGAKFLAYERSGVREYVVHLVRERELLWFRHDGERFVRTPPDEDGVHRSVAFPGLRLDEAALLRYDRPAFARTARRGLDSPEHAAFVAELERRIAERTGAS